MKHIPLNYSPPDSTQLLQQSEAFFKNIDKRRSIRHFSDREVPVQVIENIILSASTAPSGAHKQPWFFCAVSNPEIKKEIRLAAEQEEYENYHGRMSEDWIQDLEPLGTDWQKPFLEIAPWLIVVFRKVYDLEEGMKKKNYYVSESVGIASGFLLSAIHMTGLVSLTHTPSPMNFLVDILKRPSYEKPYLLVPVGYPAEDAKVPDLVRKSKNEVAKFFI